MSILKKAIAIAGLAAVTLSPISQSIAAEDTEQKKILMVISGNGADGGKTAPGYEFEELSAAYLVFTSNGLDVDIASPKGGTVEADEYDPKDDVNQLVLNDAVAMEKLNNSLPFAAVSADQYDAVFVVGGKGAMFDLPDNTSLQSLISRIYTAGGTVGAVCHGPAALVNVTLPDGSYLVDGKRVNGFTNREEKLFGKKWAAEFDFLLEDRLVERGGSFQSSPMMLSHVATDGRLITGQNPASSADAAEAVVRSLGITPVKRQMGQKERTFALIEAIMTDGDTAAQLYLADKEAFNGPLISMYGYYYAMGAEDSADYETAITLLSVETDVKNHPTLRLQVAKSWYELGDKVKALETAETILKANPDHEGAKSFIASLN